MKVTHPVHVIGAPPLTIPGELSINEDRAVFIPDQEPHGPHRLTIHDPKVGIYGKDDDDCISVSGWAEVVCPADRQPALWRKMTMESFYPVARRGEDPRDSL